MKIVSKEQTWREEVWQYFFEDDSELVVHIGEAVPANTGDGQSIIVDWQTEVPDWAANWTDEELLAYLEEQDA